MKKKILLLPKYDFVQGGPIGLLYPGHPYWGKKIKYKYLCTDKDGTKVYQEI